MEKQGMAETYQVSTVWGRIRNPYIETEVPGSKSITNRALMLAALAEGESRLENVLFSDDSRHFLQCLADLGFEMQVEEDARRVTIQGTGGRIPNRQARINVGSAGTAARFLTAMLGLSDGVYYLDASEQMRRRPMKPLLDSLEAMGALVTYQGEIGHFPFSIVGRGRGACETTVDIGHSSQFLSALLMSAPMIQDDFLIHIRGEHGMAYIQMTVSMMEQFGCQVTRVGQDTYRIESEQSYSAREYRIEPDVSAAYAMAPLLGVDVKVRDVRKDSLQGDIAFLEDLVQMGCKLRSEPDGIVICGRGKTEYTGLQADMKSCSDQTMTLAALAIFAKSPTIITGISHIRYQESDRITAIRTELERLGIGCELLEDGMMITPGEPKSAVIHTYDDHRMAMAFSLVGMRAAGIEIADPGCCRKTFEQFFSVLDSVTAQLI